jgi:hypothetical protein
MGSRDLEVDGYPISVSRPEIGIKKLKLGVMNKKGKIG